MSERDLKIKENIDLVNQLPDEINNVPFKFKSEELIGNVKKRMFKSGKGANLTIEHVDFPNGILGMMVPFMGAAGYVPSEEEIKRLLIGDEIKATKLLSKQGKEYDARLAFTADEERPYNGKTYYGNVGPVGWDN